MSWFFVAIRFQVNPLRVDGIKANDGGKIKKIMKLLGQSLALMAMIASVINALCAVSCSLQSIAGSPPSHARRVDSDGAGHACCPNQGVPKPKQQKREVPCPHQVPAADNARRNNSSTGFTAIPAAVEVGLSLQYCPQLAGRYLDPLTARDSLGLSHLSSISILRI